MGEGFIVRKGGVVTEQTLAPSILDFSVASDTSIKFKLRNNDALTATLVYRFSSLTGDGESISLATNTTSSEITLTGLTLPGTLFVTANATGKVKSNVVEEEFALVYTAATGGTTEEYNLDNKRYKSHTFTSNGTFEVTTVGDATDDRNKVDYLIIAGGGGGGEGGGGAGGYRTTFGTQGGLGTLDPKVTVTATSYAVHIGAGGAGGLLPSNADVTGNNGSNSSVAFPTTITSNGGGSGGTQTGTTGLPQSGGSGGGGSGSSISVSGASGTANQGHAGGNNFAQTTFFPAGGGGGAGSVGSAAASQTGGNGGAGLASTIRTGSSETRAGGGGGSVSSGSDNGTGGSGGGGNGSFGSTAATAGTVNTGSGGGGVKDSNSVGTSGAGGSGIVVIRYEIAPSV